jgi:hypothetical protein
MKLSICLKNGDKIEIIDRNSQYFGKKGIVIELIQRDLIINDKSGTMYILKVKLEGVNNIVDVTSHPIGLDSQIKKLK